MPEVTVQRNGELVQGVLEILAKAEDGLHVREVLRRLEDRLTLTPYEEGHYPSDPSVRRFDKVVRFATISPVKAGWLVKNRGTWEITEEGKAALAAWRDPAQLMREAARLYRKWEEEREGSTTEGDAEVPVPDESASILEEAEERAWEQVRSYLAQINPYEFQDLVEALLEAMGYHVIWKAPPGPDRGIDLIAHNDPLGTTTPRIKVQVKRRADRIDAEGIRSFMAVLGSDDVGIFVSTGGFTKNAAQEARFQETRKVTLLDETKLFDLWVEHYDRIPEEHRQLLPLRTVHFLAPST